MHFDVSFLSAIVEYQTAHKTWSLWMSQSTSKAACPKWSTSLACPLTRIFSHPILVIVSIIHWFWLRQERSHTDSHRQPLSPSLFNPLQVVLNLPAQYLWSMPPLNPIALALVYPFPFNFDWKSSNWSCFQSHLSITFLYSCQSIINTNLIIFLSIQIVQLTGFWIFILREALYWIWWLLGFIAPPTLHSHL